MNEFNLIGKIFFAPNTSDSDLIEKAKRRLKEHGIPEEINEIN